MKKQKLWWLTGLVIFILTGLYLTTYDNNFKEGYQREQALRNK